MLVAEEENCELICLKQDLHRVQIIKPTMDFRGKIGDILAKLD